MKIYLSKNTKGSSEDQSGNVSKNFSYKLSQENLNFYKNKIREKKIYNVDHGDVGSYSNLEVAQEPEIKLKVHKTPRDKNWYLRNINKMYLPVTLKLKSQMKKNKKVILEPLNQPFDKRSNSVEEQKII